MEKRVEPVVVIAAGSAVWTDGTPQDCYCHPLNPPHAATQINHSSHWLHASGPDAMAFADAVDFQAALCEAGRAPNAITGAEYGGMANFAVVR